MKYYTTCTNLETCSNIEIKTLNYDETFNIVTICSICGSYAINSTEPISEIAASDDIFYFQNLIILDQIAQDINLYEKEKQGTKNEAFKQERDSSDK